MTRVDVRLGWFEPVAHALDIPAGAWAFGIRIWIAMMAALFVAFWLQLESASSAAVCVGVLAQPKRGQALSKAFYRFLATILGFGVSIVLAALFAQDRVLTLVGFCTWLALCAFIANYLRGTRAYGAVLSGYTVAIITLSNIDDPQNVFTLGLARVAAIMVGIAAVALVNDVIASPDALPGLRLALADARGRTGAFVRARLLHGGRDLVAAADIVRTIAATRSDIPSVRSEYGDGASRAAGARSAVAALFSLVAAARDFGWARATADAGEASSLADRVQAGLDGDTAVLPGLLKQVDDMVADRAADPDRIFLHRRACDILEADTLVAQGLRALEGLEPPARMVPLPSHRDFPDALRNTARAIIAYALGATFFLFSSWPQTAFGLHVLAMMTGLSAIAPDPRVFVRGLVVGVSLAVALAGVVKFLILDDGQGFPLLAMAMAPVVVVAAMSSQWPKLPSAGVTLSVYFPLVLAPSNPQDYDPQAFLDSAVLVITSAAILFAVVSVVLPTSDARRRLWSLMAARADVLRAVDGPERDASERLSLVSDRLASFAALPGRSPVARRASLRHAFLLSDMAVALSGARAALRRLADQPAFVETARAAWTAMKRTDPSALRLAEESLLTRAATAPAAREDAVIAVALLHAARGLIAGQSHTLRRYGLRAPAREPSPPRGEVLP